MGPARLWASLVPSRQTVLPDVAVQVLAVLSLHRSAKLHALVKRRICCHARMLGSTTFSALLRKAFCSVALAWVTRKGGRRRSLRQQQASRREQCALFPFPDDHVHHERPA